MPVWNEDQFRDAAFRVIQRYRGEYSWHTWGDNAATVSTAWRLYSAAAHNRLKLLLLGDGKIRGDELLLMNFGATSGSPAVGRVDRADLDKLDAKRQALASPGRQAVPVLGRGSILNDQNWSPLMNDAFILGGVHSRREFHWAEEGKVNFDSFVTQRQASFAATRSKFGAAVPTTPRRDESYYKMQWKQYLLQGGQFWNEAGYTRVFARELIGLKTFGYEAVFTAVEVGFTPGVGSFPTFENYLNGLAEVNFQRNDRAAVNRALGQFLFGNSSALADLKPPVKT